MSILISIVLDFCCLSYICIFSIFKNISSTEGQSKSLLLLTSKPGGHCISFTGFTAYLKLNSWSSSIFNPEISEFYGLVPKILNPIVCNLKTVFMKYGSGNVDRGKK